MKNVLDSSCRENQNTHFMFNDVFPKIIICKNTVEPRRPLLTIGRMRNACWVTKARSTHSEYVILIDFTLHQWLYERAPILRFTYICVLPVLFIAYIVSSSNCYRIASCVVCESGLKLGVIVITGVCLLSQNRVLLSVSRETCWKVSGSCMI